tara:strand:- start:9584 stop:10606 length:1023 start_codon:yes stop_codon:yes gene_type:complete
MDLYGSGASISQANAQTQEARQLNQAASDFNNSLAEQLDQSNLEQDEDRSSKIQKNLLSGGTAAGKLAVLRKEGVKGLKVGGFKELPLSREEVLAKEVGAERAPRAGVITSAEELREAAGGLTGTADELAPERFAAGTDITQLTREAGLIESEAGNIVGVPTQETLAAAEAAQPEEVYTGEARLAEQEAAKASDVAGSVGVKSTAEAVEDFAKTAGKVGRVGVAGVGGALDVMSDIDRFTTGAKGLDAFGSNSMSRVGNITNIVGSGLEMLGAATGGITPWALAFEGTGALLSLGGSIAEGIGEEDAADDSKQTAADDINKQQRGMVAADTVEQAVGRTQ